MPRRSCDRGRSPALTNSPPPSDTNSPEVAATEQLLRCAEEDSFGVARAPSQLTAGQRRRMSPTKQRAPSGRRGGSLPRCPRYTLGDVKCRLLRAAVLGSCAALLSVGFVPSTARAASKPLPASPHPRHRLSDGLIPAWPWLHDYLVVHKTTFVAGHDIDGTLVVMNRGRRSVELNAGCGVKYTIVLKNRTYNPGVGFFDTCTGRPFVLRPGRNILKVKISTTYLGCTDTATQATTTHPACTASGAPPPLPPGRYTAVLKGQDLALRQPRAVGVRLKA